MTAEEIMRVTFARYWKTVEDIRMNQARKMWDWYTNDRASILGYVIEALKKNFDITTINTMNIRVYNLVKRIVNKVAAVYKLPSERMLDGGRHTEIVTGGEQAETKVVQSTDDVRYQEVVERSTIQKKSLEWHRLGKLFNTVLVQPRWMVDKVTGEGYFDFTIHTPAYTVVNPDGDNYLLPRSFYFPVWVQKDDGQPENVLVFWSDKEHYHIDALGNRKPIGNNVRMENPYKVLPIAVLRFEESTDFWGEGMWDLVDGNEEISVQFANLCNVALFQTHGQPYGFNLGLKGKPRIGADSPILVDGVREGMAQPEFGFAQANPLIQEVREMIDWMAKWLQQLKGLGSSQSTDIAAEMKTGIAKIMDNADLTEIREEDIATLQKFEENLFNIMRVVYNTHNPGKKISPTAKFSIQFGDIEVKRSTDENVKEWTAGLKDGWLSRIDIIMERTGMNREDAEKHFQRIVAEKRKFSDTFGLNDEEELPPSMVDQMEGQDDVVV